MQTDLNEETLAFIRWQNENPDVWGDQDENGVDLARLRENLTLTPAERLCRHERARRSAKTLEEAGERYRAARRTRSGVPAG